MHVLAHIPLFTFTFYLADNFSLGVFFLLEKMVRLSSTDNYGSVTKNILHKHFCLMISMFAFFWTSQINMLVISAYTGSSFLPVYKYIPGIHRSNLSN